MVKADDKRHELFVVALYQKKGLHENGDIKHLKKAANNITINWPVAKELKNESKNTPSI